ncbi:hypothetical protein [Streptomyces sp. A5-4]|uniref:hypothetical protein n=1 Tax=Streptomyces sp. A5-4 TaxID=3384771 RepID=UPI003DA94C01
MYAPVDNIVFSSVLHEIYSYAPALPADKRRAYAEALTHAIGALVPGGRLIIRDFVAPAEISDDEWKHRLDDWDHLLDAEDPETDGTFGHLPGCQLPDSIEGAFDMVLLGYKDTTIDLNAHCTIEHRMRQALNRAVTLDLDLDEVDGMNRMLTLNRRIERAFELDLSTAEGRTMPRPVVAVGLDDVGQCLLRHSPLPHCAGQAGPAVLAGTLSAPEGELVQRRAEGGAHGRTRRRRCPGCAVVATGASGDQNARGHSEYWGRGRSLPRPPGLHHFSLRLSCRRPVRLDRLAFEDISSECLLNDSPR